MSEWWTYRLSDLILFSPDVYYRTFALYHRRIWPVHLVLLGFIALVTVAMNRRSSDLSRQGRFVALLLAACWLWTGLAFHLGSYAAINWAARYFAVAFVIQAAVLLWFGVIRSRVVIDAGAARAGLIALIVVGIAAPLAGLLSGRQWDQVELPGLTPDPTAVVTILMLRIAVPRAPRIALVIPMLWCVIGGLTLWALESREALWTWGAALGALLLPVSRREAV
jgi:hypothetical protein